MSGGNQICEKPLTDRKRRDRIFSGFQNCLLRSATLRPVVNADAVLTDSIQLKRLRAEKKPPAAPAGFVLAQPSET
jgi:hypothetical protein